MKTAIVIRAFNEEAHIGRLLTGIDHQTMPADEVIVVDSGSTDATVAIAEAFGARIVSIAKQEFSFGRALNRGIETADAELVVLASAHVYPIFDDWLLRLLEPFEEDDVAVSFGRQTVPPGGSLSERRLLEQWFPPESHHAEVDPFCNNANAAIRRSLWVQHPYDEQLTGLEDIAWAKGALGRGSRIAYVAEAPVVHVHDESFSQIINRYRREAIAHKAIFPEQQLGSLSAVRLCFANMLGDFAVAARERRLRNSLLDILRFRIAQFYGSARGFSQSGPVTQSLKRRFYYPPAASSETPDDERNGAAIDYDRASART